MMTTLMLTGEPLTIADVVAVARERREVGLAGRARMRVEAARALVERIVAEEQVVYGVTTGFGSLSKVHIPTNHLGELQHNLVRSHAAGVGPPLPPDVVRAMLLLAAASLARGASGVRQAVVEALLGMLNHGIVPLVPSRGSVGASGDLAPLAHIALVLIGEGQAIVLPEGEDGGWRMEDGRPSSILHPPSSAEVRLWLAGGWSDCDWRPRRGWRCSTVRT